MQLGVERLKDYQGDAYARLFMKRMEPFVRGDRKLAQP